jgi:hypothetical protein
VSPLSAEPVRLPEQTHLSGVYRLREPDPALTQWQAQRWLDRASIRKAQR